MLDWIMKIGGMFLGGGGWGSAVAIVGAIALFFILRNWWNTEKQKKAEKDQKDNQIIDHEKIIKDHHADQSQANKDDAANEAALKNR